MLNLIFKLLTLLTYYACHIFFQRVIGASSTLARQEHEWTKPPAVMVGELYVKFCHFCENIK